MYWCAIDTPFANSDFESAAGFWTIPVLYPVCMQMYIGHSIYAFKFSKFRMSR